jgi:SAM-dependent methyltransferase
MFMRKKKSPATREWVVAGYRVLLGREPENEAVVAEKMAHCHSEEDVLRAFTSAPEFSRSLQTYTQVVTDLLNARLKHVDISVPDEIFEQLFLRIRDQWTALTNSEPFWSVVSDERFRTRSIAQYKAEFYAGGSYDDHQIDTFCQRTLTEPPRGVCLELGCGVGRVTRVLARRFERVIGVDISEANLTLADQHLQREGVNNVGLLLLRDLKQLEQAEDFDFFYSILVLQHNPPPIIARMLQIILRKLRRGGSFFFQVPTLIAEYEFDAGAYLNTSPAESGYEIHALPMHAVLDIIVGAGARIREVMADTRSGGPGSQVFFGIKP